MTITFSPRSVFNSNTVLDDDLWYIAQCITIAFNTSSYLAIDVVVEYY